MLDVQSGAKYLLGGSGIAMGAGVTALGIRQIYKAEDWQETAWGVGCLALGIFSMYNANNILNISDEITHIPCCAVGFIC